MNRRTFISKTETTTRSIADSVRVATTYNRIKGWKTNSDGSRTIYINENYSLMFRDGEFRIRERRTKANYRVSGVYTMRDNDSGKDSLRIKTIRRNDGEDTEYTFEFVIREGV